MNGTVELITSITQLSGTALAIGVLIYVLAYFRKEVQMNREKLTELFTSMEKTVIKLQEGYTKSLQEERGVSRDQEGYIRELTKDMIGVLNVNNSHLQTLINQSNNARSELERTITESMKDSNNSLLSKLKILGTALEIKDMDFYK